jgi:hypothetical protein
MAKKEFHFSIEESSPQTLAMARLVDYLKQLSILLGSRDKVHFLRVDEGSAACTMEVEESEEEIINNRVLRASKGQGPKDAMRAYRNIRMLLEDDDKSAYMEWKDGDVVVHFPKKARAAAETFGPFWQDGSLDGILVKVGGLDETVPVHLIYERAHHTCNTTREVARQLGHHLYGKPIRVHGRGKWYRNADAKWELRWFDIYNFEELDDSTLLDVVRRLRAIPDNKLSESKDPIRDMQRIRHGG